MPSIILIKTHTPTGSMAQKIVNLLIEKHLIACGTIYGPAQTHYIWEETLTKDEIIPIELKTTKTHLPEVLRIIQDNHPDIIPEIIVYESDISEISYVKWIHQTMEQKHD